MIKVKNCKKNGIATIDDVKSATDYILNVNATVLDEQGMTMRLVWHEDTVSVAVQQPVVDYDLLRRGSLVAGKIIINDVNVTAQDVAIIITHPNESETVRYVITDVRGCFAIGGLPVPSVIFDRVMLVLPACRTFELESEPLSTS